MVASRIATALSALVLLPLGLAACGSDEVTADSPTTASPATQPSQPTETSSDDGTSQEPMAEGSTTEPTEAALGDWCTSFESVAQAVQTLLSGDGEWTMQDRRVLEPGETDTFTERLECSMRQGEPMQGLVLAVSESQYPDEATAAAALAAFRDDTDPMATSEVIDVGDVADEAIFNTYNGEMAVPAFTSSYVLLREADREVRLYLRDHDVDAPVDPATRRDQILQLVELLQP